jgi:DNA-binding LytR/AlgR family response regulator
MNMPTMTIDNDLVQAMRSYLVACNRVENAEERSDVTAISRLRQEQAEAARQYERALVTRGWRAPAREVSLVG